eukprot:TRINITY_DN120984_c0_g1_i1.p1 TRINITY_DN120984_c0_g1~~TRINITY_DN120984_c0_g1_i1.p1  ORF type:complete len:195 (+),score=21.98 TRINITY_DN120984_c0_g1_i1:77-586(+)
MSDADGGGEMIGNAEEEEPPAQVTMFNKTGGSARLGEKSSDYAGCWRYCGGFCFYRLTPCGDGCINKFPFLCGIIPVPVCCCAWYVAGDHNGEFKEICEGKDGGRTVIHMVDEKTIKLRPSALPKDYGVNASDRVWGLGSDDKARRAIEAYNRDKRYCGECCFTYTKVC